jgi:hypothetical protein
MTFLDYVLDLLHKVKFKQCRDLIVPVLTIPILIGMYFISAVVFLLLVFMPFLLLVPLIP